MLMRVAEAPISEAIMGTSDQKIPPVRVERRSGVDRRQTRRAPLFTRIRRRRSAGRRRTDKNGYIDIYDFRTRALAASIIVLSLLDAVLTAAQLQTGRITEANPVMAQIILVGGLPTFFAFKVAMTALPLALIILHKEWALGRIAARFCLWVYICLMVYHAYLLVESPIHAGIFTGP
jgi:hypothetical protein